ncbi:MAG: phosphotransferase [Patescibacteria group bacterium]
MSNEEQLTGGRSASEVVRIGDTVHRSLGPNSDFVHNLLTQLEQKDFNYSPRFLGIDEKGREILSYIEGKVPTRDHEWTMEQMIDVVHIMKKFHEATNDAICHHDIAPWNIVLKDNVPIALIDFDEATTGDCIDDLAYFLWTFLDLGSDTPIETQTQRIKVLCREYGYKDYKTLVEKILKQQNYILEMRIKKSRTDSFSADAVESIKNEIAWVEENREKLESIAF